MKAFVVLSAVMVATCWCKDLITKEGADRIKATGATWEVIDPDQSALKNISKEEFIKRLQKEWPKGASKLLQLEAEFGDDMQNSTNRLMQQSLPTEFDGRKEWGKCIHSGRDQIDCSGCWAFGVANHLSDRFCIAGRDAILSVQDLLECTPGNKCCDGGSAENAYNHMMLTGIVDESCKPYDESCIECRPTSCPRFKCQKNSAWVTSNVLRAKWEIIENGPITAIYDIYEDFSYYKSGVYYRTSDEKIGVHSVTLVGWGTELGMPYWICKNSWGDNWGDKGFFKIKIGECGIDSYMTSCKPLIEEF